MTNETPEFKVGDNVWYENGGEWFEATITGIGKKDGRLTYDCWVPEFAKYNDRWGYAYQFRALARPIRGYGRII